MNNPTEIRDTLHLRERAEERSTRKLMCAGVVRADGVVVYFPEPGREPVIVAKGQVEGAEA